MCPSRAAKNRSLRDLCRSPPSTMLHAAQNGLRKSRPWMVTPPFSGIKVEHFETCLLRQILFTLWQIREWHPRLIEDNTRVFLVAGTQLIKSKSLTEHDRVPSVVQKHLLKFRVTQPASTCSRLSNLRLLLLRSARTG